MIISVSGMNVPVGFEIGVLILPSNSMKLALCCLLGSGLVW